MRSLDLGASAKCMLPYVDRTVYAQSVQCVEQEDPERKAALEKEVEGIRRRGYACTEGEVDSGARTCSSWAALEWLGTGNLWKRR